MKLSYTLFLVLRAIGNASKSYTQRELCEKTNLSLGSVNRALKDAHTKGYVAQGLSLIHI